jgi:hypothetical protein
MTNNDYENLITLLEQALKFYANEKNYSCAMGNLAGIDCDEQGYQARFALKKINEFRENSQKIEDDYQKFINDIEKTTDYPETINDILNNLKNR